MFATMIFRYYGRDGTEEEHEAIKDGYSTQVKGGIATMTRENGYCEGEF